MKTPAKTSICHGLNAGWGTRRTRRTLALLVTAPLLLFCEAALGQTGVDKISAEVPFHQDVKRRPPGMDPDRHRQMLSDLGVNTARTDGEECAIYTAQPLTQAEIAELALKGIDVTPGLWVPPVAGKHPLGFHLAIVSYASLDAVRADARILKMVSTEFAHYPNNDLGKKQIQADKVHAGLGVAARTGLGITIAVADSGLDLTHADFPTPVEAFDVTTGRTPATWSTNVANTVSPHGTHVTSSVLGRGALSPGGKFKGSAPAANLCFYKIGNDSTGSASTTDMIEALDRAVQVGARIFTMSYGGINNYLDGSEPMEQTIDAAVAAGVVVFISAGNDGDDSTHDSVSVAPASSSATFSFSLSNATGSAALTDSQWVRLIWRDGTPADANITLSCSNLGAGESVTEVFSGNSVRGTEGRLFQLTPNIAAGGSKTFNLTLQNSAATGPTVQVQCYLFSNTGTFTSPDSGNTVGHPATADGAVAVGAWVQRSGLTDWRGSSWSFSNTVNTLATFSSRGPRIDGLTKPDIVAPGSLTIAARDSVAGLATTDYLIIDNDGVNQNAGGPANYYAMQGTSMACPMAAGVAALLLEANPTLTPAEVRQILTSTATNGATPNNQVGHGLLDALAAVAAVPAAPHLYPNGLTLVTESVAPANSQIDAGESVTVSLSLRNIGSASTANLVATLLPEVGATGPGSPQTYGALVPDGAAVQRQFTFQANGPMGGMTKLRLALADGAVNLGIVEFPFALAAGTESTATQAGGAGITIPTTAGAGTPYPSTLNVSGVAGTLAKVKVNLNGLTHTWPDDVRVLLVGPEGQKVLLFANAGGNNAISGANLIFDDAAASTLPDTSLITSGTYRPGSFGTATLPSPAPSGPYGSQLAAFNGRAPNGLWQLFVSDGFTDDGGSLSNWSLTLTSTVPGPAGAGSAELSVTVAASSNAMIGQSQTMVATVKNLGPVNATNVAVTYALPPGAQYDSGSVSQGSLAFATPTATATLGSIAVGGSATVSITFTPLAGESYSHAFSAVATQTDINLSNNSVVVNQTVGTVDLAPYQPAEWANQILIVGYDAIEPATTTQERLWAYFATMNNGTLATDSGFNTALYLDGNLIITRRFDGNLDPEYYTTNWGYLSALTPGAHTIRVVIDSDNEIAESDESNNEQVRNITVTGLSQPNITPYIPLIVSTATGTSTDATSISNTQTVYVDWYAINWGPAVSNAALSFQIWVDGTLRNTWTNTPPLPASNYLYVTDYSIGTLSTGTHTIRLVVDSANTEAETNETDNESIKTIVVGTPALTAPATNTAYGNPVSVAYTLPVAAQVGSVSLTFANATNTRVLTLASSVSGAGSQSFSFDPASPTSTSAIASMSGGASIPSGTYSVTLSYRDTGGIGPSTVTNSSVTLDLATQAPTLSVPANNGSGLTTNFLLDFTLPDVPKSSSAQVVFTGAATRTLTLANWHHTSGRHRFYINTTSPLGTGSPIAGISGGSSIPAGVYAVTLQYQDSLSNAMAQALSTNVTLVAPEPIIDVSGNSQIIASGDVTPDSADHTAFGSVLLSGGTLARTFTITNPGTADLNLTGNPKVAVSGANAADFTVTSQPASPVSSDGGLTTFTVTFDPSAVGTRNASLSIASNDSDRTPYTFALQGDGVAPDIGVAGNSNAIVDGSVTASTANHTDWGGVVVNGESVTRTFTVANSGTSTLNLTGSPKVALTGSSSFSVETQPDSPLLIAGFTTFSVAFDPDTAGAHAATLSIDNDDPDEAPYTFVIAGIGLVPEMTISGNSNVIANNDLDADEADHTDFGTVDMLNAQLTRTYTIGNGGDAVLNLTGLETVEISGDHAADFQVTLLPQTSVAIDGAAEFAITFDPSLPGWRTATVTIASDDPLKNPYTFAIRGFGGLSTLLTQTITFAAPATLYQGQSPVTLAAYASSGLPVTLAWVSGPASLDGNVITFTGAGSVKVMATQPGDGVYKAAAPVTRTITVKLDPTALTLVNLSQTYDGTPKPIAVVGTEESVTLRYNIGGVFGPTAPTAAGTYPVEAEIGTLKKTGKLVIAKAPLFVTADDKRKFAGQVNPELTFGYTGFVNGETAAVITKAPLVTTTAKTASPGGAYPITTSGGAAANYSFVHRRGTMAVESFAGAYEALLVDAATLPACKLSLNVVATGQTFTGKLFTATETAALPLAGPLTTDALNEEATGTATVLKNGIAYVVTFTLPMYGDVLAAATRDDQPLAAATDGKKLSTKTVLYAGAHTALLEPATPPDSDVPAGAGWATGTISTKGVLTLAGKLADGSAFTTALSPDTQADPGYRLFVQPYVAARTQSFLGGAFTLSPHPLLTNRRFLEAADLTWQKTGLAADASYRGGFGPLASILTLDPWQKPLGASTLAVRLGLTGNSFQVAHSATGSDSHTLLPTDLSLSSTNVVSITAPLPNTTKWTTKFNITTGTFTGSFELLDGAAKRPVPFTGILRQPAAEIETVIGDGHFLLPALPGALSNEKVSGEILFQR